MDAIRKIIQEEVSLIFEAFDMQNQKKSYVPTDAVAKIAGTALQAIEIAKKNGITPSSIDLKGNQGNGRQKAQQLAKKTSQSFAEMKRLKAFFDANLKKVEDERRSIGVIQQRKGTTDEMVKSNILLVWNLHGGDVCKKWVDLKLSDTHEQGNKKKERLRAVGGADTNNGMGVFKTIYDPSQQRINR